MFLFVFYFQGVKGDDPITAGIKLAPLAIGMLIASPLAGIYADRHGSRDARRGRDGGQRRRRSPAMTTLGVDTPYWQIGAVAVRRRRRLGHVQLAQHGRDDGHGAAEPPRDRRRRADDAAEHRRGDLDRVRAGDRHLLGADKDALFKIFSGVTTGLSRRDSSTRSSPTCTWRCGCWRRRRWSAPASRCCGRSTGRRRRRRGSRTSELRIGEVARLSGTTPRTVRYYEEIGLLPARRGARRPAQHREYTRRRRRAPARAAAPEELLGLSLDELQDRDGRRGRARRAPRARASDDVDPAERRAAARRGAGAHRLAARARPPPAHEARARESCRGRAATQRQASERRRTCCSERGRVNAVSAAWSTGSSCASAS